MRAMCRTGVARTIRESNDLSLREVGVEVGVSQVTIHRWENSQTRPAGAEAMRYLDILDDLSGVSS